MQVRVNYYRGRWAIFIGTCVISSWPNWRARSLEIFTENLGEVRSLVVAENFKGRGLGHLLVKRIVTEARTIGLSRLMALTYAPGFFHKLGFRTVSKGSLPEKVWGACVKCYKFNNCDETAVLLELNRKD